MKEFIKHLLDVFFPDPKKKHCPHCGGGQCLSLCGILGAQTEQGNPRRNGTSAPGEKEKRSRSMEVSRQKISQG